jgi:hypothetical protein
LTTIPASIDVDVIPGVVGAGGNALATVGLCLDNSTRVPISPLGSILEFSTAAEVGDYFGLGSPQENFATTYFNGFTGRTAIPSTLLFAQYPAWAVSAWLRGGPLGLTLTQLQALSGSLTVVMDGYSHVISSISLAGYNSFSAAAAGIQAAFTDPTEASFTASMGASFTATAGSLSTELVVTAVTGYISEGDELSGTGITSGSTVVEQISGTPGGAGTYGLSHSNTASAASITSTSTVLNVTVDTDHALAPGQTVVNADLTGSPVILSQISGTAGTVGLYQLSGAQQSVASASFTAVATAPVVTYDSVSGAFVITSGVTGTPSTSAFATGTLAAPLQLTQATGAVLSQGANATTPAVFMDILTALNQDWVSFTTDFEPDAAYFVGSISTTTLIISELVSGVPIIGDTVSGPSVAAGTIITGGSGLVWTINISQTVLSGNLSSFAPGGGHGNTEKLAFAAWNNSVPDEYMYAMWDTDITPTESFDATNSAGYIVNDLEYEGTAPIYEPTDLLHASFLMGSIASINFAATNGRTNLKFRTQAGLVPSVTSETVAVNLNDNGYNCVGAVATASEKFIYWRNGQVSGKFLWIDSYINQIWLNAMMQQTLLELLLAIGSLPYNPQGYNLIAGALTGGSALPIVQPPASPVAAALNFGAIRPNVPLSASQAEEVNNAAGLAIDGILSTRGWYLQILPPTAQVRAARGTPICNFWYTDGQSINQITLNSIEVE